MKYFNPSISEDKNRILNLKSGDDTAEMPDYLTPIIEIKPVADIIKIKTSDGAIHALPSDKDFYLTGITLSFAKVVGDTGSQITVTGVVKGVTTTLVSPAMITLTAERDTVAEAYDPPIKLDRGSSTVLNFTGTFSSARVITKGYFREITRN